MLQVTGVPVRRWFDKLTTNGKMDWHRCRNQSDSWLPEFRYSL